MTTLETQHKTGLCFCQQWRVAAFVDITRNVEASSNLRKTVPCLSKLAQFNG